MKSTGRMRGLGGIVATVLVLLVSMLQLPANGQSSNELDCASALTNLNTQIASLSNELATATAKLKSIEATNTVISNSIDRVKIAAGLTLPEKRIRVHHEAEYLHDQVFGPYGCDQKKRVKAYRGQPRRLLELTAYELRLGQVTAGDASNTVTNTEELFAGASQETYSFCCSCDRHNCRWHRCKSWAISNQFNTELYANRTTKQLIADMHKELANPDWLTDSIRFGGLIGFVDEVDAVTAQVALRVYAFAYHRHLPGRWFSLVNWARRASFILAAGPVVSRDETLTDDIGIVWTTGLGFDLRHGVSLLAGYSTYPETPIDGDKEWNDSFTFGVALNAELFEGLMNGAKR